MLFCLVAGLFATAVQAYVAAYAVFGGLVNLAPHQLTPAILMLTLGAVMSAAPPLYLPRIANAIRGIALGVATGVLVGIATSLFDREAPNPLSVVVMSGVLIALTCTVSALVAYFAGVGLSLLARRLASGSRARWKSVVAASAGLLVFGAYLFWPQIVFWINLEPNYRLAPSIWEGEITATRIGANWESSAMTRRSYPIRLVIERVEPDGRFIGAIRYTRDIYSEFRIEIEGQATGNHLVFSDTRVLQVYSHSLEPAGFNPLEKNVGTSVWIRGSLMKGGGNGGLTGLNATLVTPSAGPRLQSQLRPGQAPAIAEPGAPGVSVSAIAPTPGAPTGGEPPRPPDEFPIALDHDGEALWLSRNGNRTNLTELLRWRPTTGSVEQYRVSEPTLVFAPGSQHSVAATPFGLLIFGGQYVASRQWQRDPARVVLLNTKNQVAISRLHVGRERPYVLVLRDKSVLVLGGVVGYDKEAKTFTNAVERITFRDGELAVEQLPDLPGEIRRGVSFVELSDGRVMALGGSTSRYVGYEPMIADTYILDLAARAWQVGPKMTEPRTNATATLLPDGGVMVAGGWSPKHTWNDVPSRSTERLDPRGKRFAPGAPLTVGVAGHQAIWVSGQQGKQLLVAGGMVRAWNGSNAVQAYDFDSAGWRSTGESCPADSKGGEIVAVPVSFDGRAYLWCTQGGDGPKVWSLVSLRIQSSGMDGSQRIRTEAGITLQRWGIAFLPPQGDAPGLAAGGSVNGVASAAVEAIRPDGRIQSVASLNHSRTSAQVFRLKDGSFLVVGGVSGDRTRSTLQFPPPELLPAGTPIEKARWVTLELEMDEGAALGQLSDGSLIAVKPGGIVERLIISGASEGNPTIQRSSFPSLNRNRRQSGWEAGVEGGTEFLMVRELRDGRIIVAGGEQQRHGIAVLDENTMSQDVPDRFVGIGDYIPSTTHEIYDPATKIWRETAPSRGRGGRVAILDDGSVVKWGGVPVGAAIGKDETASLGLEARGILEISTADGKSWREFEAQEAPAIKTDLLLLAAHPYVAQGELFLLGKHRVDAAPHRARDDRMVQWFNTADRRWVTLWEAPERDWRDHLGRIIFRDLPGGKRVVLPVAGL